MYWGKPGKQNTESTIQTVKEAIKKRKIKHIVFPSSTGFTASEVSEAELGADLVCVTHVFGFRSPGEQEFPKDLKDLLERKGMRFLTGTHVLSGAERGMSNKFGGIYPVEIMADTLRMFGQGTKVAVEVAVMALDAGLIPYNEDIISMAGSGEGLDTAVVIRPAHAANIFDTFISEVLCKPVER